MKKARQAISKATRDAVLSEFNHRCAICSGDKPQIHHMNEDPSDNDVMNLIPLCPNCHLIDQHNPTKEMEPDKLRLFREHKDPAILKPQFHALYLRVKFLDSIRDDDDVPTLQSKALELKDFVLALEMGPFYGDRIHKLTPLKPYLYTQAINQRLIARHHQEYREQLRSVRAEVYRLIVELLRFQKW